MLILPSKSQRGERAVFELPEPLDCGRCIGEQEGLALWVFRLCWLFSPSVRQYLPNCRTDGLNSQHRCSIVSALIAWASSPVRLAKTVSNCARRSCTLGAGVAGICTLLRLDGLSALSSCRVWPLPATPFNSDETYPNEMDLPLSCYSCQTAPTIDKL